MVESLYPDIRADSPMDKNAKKAKLIENAVESVNELNVNCRMRFVSGIAADDADINRYAVTYNTAKVV